MIADDRDALIRLSAALAARDPQRLREAMELCAREADPEAVEEVLLQSYLFLGYPVALSAFGLWRELSGREASAAVSDDWEGWSQRGAELCQIVYGGQYEGLRRNVRALHPDMEGWMVVEGYGKVLGRPQLDLPTRELCIVALLAVLGMPRQLHSHLRGALNAGATLEEVEEVMKTACRQWGEEGCQESWATWEGVRTRWTDSK